MVYKVSVKSTWRLNDGSRLEPGMQDVSDAFMRNYGVSIFREKFGFATNYLSATKL